MWYLTEWWQTFSIIGIRGSARALKWYKPDGSIFISKKIMNFLRLVKTNKFELLLYIIIYNRYFVYKNCSFLPSLKNS